MDRSALQRSLQDARARLDSGGPTLLAEAGVTSGAAFLALHLLQALARHPDQDEVGDLLGALGKERRRVLRRAMDGDLTALLARLTDTPDLDDACRALVEYAAGAEQAGLNVQMRMEVSDRSSARNNRQVVVAPGGMYVEAPRDEAAERRERALIDYLRAQQHTCRPVQLVSIDAHESRFQRTMRLEQVYISLQTTSRVALTAEERAALERNLARRLRSPEDQTTRPLPALEALGGAPARRVMLLGAPGSGKSTFVNHLVLCLAGARLCAHHGEDPPEPDWLERLPGWTLGALLPIRIVLRELAAYPPLVQARAGSLDLLLGFLREALGSRADALDAMQTALTDGEAALLFDGLDEVVGEPALTRVVETITAAAGTYQRAPVLTTCRVLDYQANPRRQIRGFTPETIAPLSDEQIDAFIVAWYAELAASERQVLGNVAALRQAVAARAELRELARLPLLLTMMAVVHAGKGELPDARALLYAECIDLLLLRWRQEPGGQDVLERLNLPQFRAVDLLGLMARLGFAAHELAARETLPADAPADLTKPVVRRILEDAFAAYTPGDELRREQLASQVLHAIAMRNGLLLKGSGEGEEVYTFPHRSFQEFLAGYYLSSHDDYEALCLERAPQIHWHEALRLMASYQVLALNQRGQPLSLAGELLGGGPLEQTLAGEILNLVGWERASAYREAYVRPGGLWQRANDALRVLATQGKPPEVPATLRVRAGLAADLLGYGPTARLSQPESSIPLPDRRLPLAVLGLPAANEAWWRPALDDYWCPVAPGPFWHGDDRKEKLRQVELLHGYRIGRYPVTNAEFARFIAAGGYDPQQPWWTEQGRAFLAPGGHPYDDQEQPITLPRLWGDPRFNSPTQPVVAVSWYEAAAYCAWLTMQGHADGWLPKHDVLRLPTWLEWERATRGTDQRRYPWGTPVPTPEHANYDETKLGAPSPIGCFPAGAAPCGAHDMAGNVCEWTATDDKQPEATIPKKDFTPNNFVVLSWTYYGTEKERLCCGARDGDGPFGRFVVLGFRVVWSLAPRL